MRELSSRLAGRSNRRVLTIIISRFWTADVPARSHLAFWGAAASAVSAPQIGDPAPDCDAAVAALVLATVSAVPQVIVHLLRRHPL